MDIKYTDGRISDLTIMNVTKNSVAYTMKRNTKKPGSTDKQDQKPNAKQDEPKAPTKPDDKKQLQDRLVVKPLVKTDGTTEYAECENCGNYIYAVNGKDGKTISVSDFCAMGLRRFGKAVCKNCFAELNERKNAAK